MRVEKSLAVLLDFSPGLCWNYSSIGQPLQLEGLPTPIEIKGLAISLLVVGNQPPVAAKYGQKAYCFVYI